MTDENTAATTEPTATENSGATTTADQSTTAQASDTSTTDSPAADEGIDLAADIKDDAAADGTGDKTDGDDGDDGEQSDEDKAKATAEAERAEFYGAPADDVDYDIKLPDDAPVDAEALKAIAPALRKLNLSNAGATELLTNYAEHALPIVAKQVTSQIETQVLDQRKAWETEARQAIAGKNEKGQPIVRKNDAGDELSFDGKNVEAVRRDAARALDRIAPAGFRDFLKETGLSQHPAMVAFAYQAGKLLAEDSDVSGSGGGAPKEKSRVEKYYG
jgi:hypothetical protein